MSTLKAPHWFVRKLDLQARLNKKSYFLFGPRQTGKTALIRHTLPNALLFDLLDAETFTQLSREPFRILQELEARPYEVVVIDEIQRLPSLLNEVHRLIEQTRTNFLLTGSSARKLRKGGVNLLGGRARTAYLYPLCFEELGSQFDLNRVLQFGSLPSIWFSEEPEEDLSAYVGSYLTQEIVAEALVRNIGTFSRFLQTAALSNATIAHFTNIANDAQVPRTTVYEYFEILRDTLILHELPAWKKSKTRKPIVSSKYYFFDTGVVHQLQGRKVLPGTPEYGLALETYLFHELRAYRDYEKGPPISFWRSASHFEVDFLLEDHTAIEVKAKSNITPRDLKGLNALAEESTFKRLICVSLEKRRRKAGPILVLPLVEFLEELWAGNLA